MRTGILKPDSYCQFPNADWLDSISRCFPQKSTYHVTQSALRTVQSTSHATQSPLRTVQSTSHAAQSPLRTVQSTSHAMQRRLCETQTSVHLATQATLIPNITIFSKRKKTEYGAFHRV